jgi:hypothetical protein
MSISRMRRQHAAVADQEGFGGEAYRPARARDLDAAAIQDIVGDLDRAGIFVIQARATLEIDQPRVEARFFAGCRPMRATAGGCRARVRRWRGCAHRRCLSIGRDEAMA